MAYRQVHTIQVVQTRSVDKFKKKKGHGKSTGNTDFQKVGEKKTEELGKNHESICPRNQRREFKNNELSEVSSNKRHKINKYNKDRGIFEFNN